MPVTSVRPIVWRIAQAIADRLQKLTAGYSLLTRVSEVVLSRRLETQSPKNGQIMVKLGQKTRMEDLDCPGNPPAICWQQQVEIRCHVIPSTKDPTPLDEIIETYAADIQKVIVDAGNMWYTFGGLAVQTEFTDFEPIENDGAITGVNVPVIVTYRVSENDPYEARA